MYANGECLLISDFWDNEQRALQKDFYVVIMNDKAGLSFQGANGSVDVNKLEQSMGYSLVLAYFGELITLSSRSTLYL